MPPTPRKKAIRRAGKTDPAAIARWEREIKCLQMRKEGCDWDTCVERLGYASRGHAHDSLRRFMHDYPAEDVAAFRELEKLRIEMKMTQLEPGCVDGNPRAIEVWAKLSERLSRLMGGDAPERKEITVLTEDVMTAAIRKLEEELGTQDRESQREQA